MATGSYNRRRLIGWLRTDTAQATGRRYQIDFDARDVQSLRGLVRLIRDQEKWAAVNRTRLMPGRRWAVALRVRPMACSTAAADSATEGTRDDELQDLEASRIHFLRPVPGGRGFP